jgi:N-acetylmuramoyl-L-alanine amidase
MDITSWYKNNRQPFLISTGFIFATIILILVMFFQNSVSIKLDQVILRANPSPAAKQVNVATRGTRLTIMEEKHGWYLLRREDNEETGWAPSWIAQASSIPSGTPTRISEATIVLDPGHGGEDPGSKTSSNTKNPNNFEKTYTLKTALTIKSELEKTGARVILTRDKDELIGGVSIKHSLQTIAKISTENSADAFISIHYDSTDIDEKNEATGHETFYYHGTNGSYELAEELNKALKNLPLDNRGIDTGDYLVIRDTDRPSTLLELGFMNNREDFQTFSSNAYRKRVAVDVRKALETYFNKVAPTLKYSEVIDN